MASVDTTRSVCALASNPSVQSGRTNDFVKLFLGDMAEWRVANVMSKSGCFDHLNIEPALFRQLAVVVKRCSVSRWAA